MSKQISIEQFCINHMQRAFPGCDHLHNEKSYKFRLRWTWGNQHKAVLRFTIDYKHYADWKIEFRNGFTRIVCEEYMYFPAYQGFATKISTIKWLVNPTVENIERVASYVNRVACGYS